MMKKLYVLLVFVMSFVFLTACTSRVGLTTKNNDLETVALENDIVLTIDSEGDFSIIYKTDQERLNDPNVVAVIEGEVLTSEYLYVKPSFFTKSAVRVNTVLKGDMEEGEILTVAERGGYIPYEVYFEKAVKDKFPDAEPKDKAGVVEELCNGVNVMQPSEKVILYLVKMDNPGDATAKPFTDGQLYWVAGTVQGKMVLDNGIYKMQLPKDWTDVERKDYTLQEFSTFVSSNE